MSFRCCVLNFIIIIANCWMDMFTFDLAYYGFLDEASKNDCVLTIKLIPHFNHFIVFSEFFFLL